MPKKGEKVTMYNCVKVHMLHLHRVFSSNKIKSGSKNLGDNWTHLLHLVAIQYFNQLFCFMLQLFFLTITYISIF